MCITVHNVYYSYRSSLYAYKMCKQIIIPLITANHFQNGSTTIFKPWLMTCLHVEKNCDAIFCPKLLQMLAILSKFFH